MLIYRAFAYQLQPLHTRGPELQPEIMVLFESATPESSGATLLRALGLAWGCGPAEVDFYNLEDEHALRRSYGEQAPGDAALWVSAEYHGPMFHPLDRTLLLVRPLTLRRLMRAREDAEPIAARQREAARQADQADQALRRQRQTFMADMAQMLRSQG